MTDSTSTEEPENTANTESREHADWLDQVEQEAHELIDQRFTEGQEALAKHPRSVRVAMDSDPASTDSASWPGETEAR
ncbi:hypothetical protein EV191_101389 [Tamaricihabitans halophyticus]|uniref:Uncharacterized protein n=1 Tax=Tamaricihabitans halophyticus TaxID=1262583 RepID=A0A4V2SUY6_9PSEU|nr:hypothetical protein [Tamaricihabitans halophyticus]TCP56446.1 hypothetical protein EV191_101389 [Tamaricihabitans halophyticus]